jgi:RsmE family RNA methyltransferase
VNLVLFEPAEIEAPLPRRDPRAVHVLEVLHRQIGDTFDAGIVNGPRGKARLDAVTGEALALSFSWTTPPAPPPPITLLVGLPRPQTARDILRDMTTLGVAALHFARTEKGDPNYASSTLWRDGEWRRHALAGAAQAFDTHLPEITFGRPLNELVAALPPGGTRLALDNYESPTPLSAWESVTQCVTLTLGAERGWSAGERALLRENGFMFVHLGPRVLRAETACVAAVTLVRAKLGLL